MADKNLTRKIIKALDPNFLLKQEQIRLGKNVERIGKATHLDEYVAEGLRRVGRTSAEPTDETASLVGPDAPKNKKNSSTKKRNNSSTIKPVIERGINSLTYRSEAANPRKLLTRRKRTKRVSPPV